MRSLTTRLTDLLQLVEQCLRSYGYRRGLPLAYALWRVGRRAGVHQVSVPGLAAPVHLRGGTSDAAVFVQIFLQQELDFPLSSDPKVIIDGGANIGLSTLYLRRRFPAARIIAVEFEASNFELMQRNLAGAGDVECVHAALWPSNGKIGVGNPGAAKWAYYPVATDDPTKAGTEAISVSELMARYSVARVDLLKLDVEGSEYELFAKPPEWLADVGAIAIELHDALRPGSGKRFIRSIVNREFRLSARGEYLVCEFAA